jgi:hypothetical protein
VTGAEREEPFKLVVPFTPATRLAADAHVFSVGTSRNPSSALHCTTYIVTGKATGGAGGAAVTATEDDDFSVRVHRGASPQDPAPTTAELLEAPLARFADRKLAIGLVATDMAPRRH